MYEHGQLCKVPTMYMLQADATVLSTLVVLQHVVSAGGREKHRPTVHVVGMVRRPSTVEVANYLVGEPPSNVLMALRYRVS